MKIKFNGSVFVSLIIISLLVLPAFIQAENQKIKVVAEDTNIRIKPDMKSELIGTPAVGTVFEVEKKIGEWYEITFLSRVGVSITGYIHEIFVEIVVVEEEPPPKFNINLGGLFYLVQAGYDYQYTWTEYSETAAIYDSVENGNAMGFNLGFGFFVLPYVEITAGMDYLSTSLSGNYGYDLPNEFIYNDIAHDDAPADAKFTEIIFNLGVNLHPVKKGMIRPYVGGGISYIMGKMDLLYSFMVYEDYYLDGTHWVEITEVSTVKESINKLGFNFKAGINFAISRRIFVFSEGRYIIAKKTITHPGTPLFGEGQEIEIDLGGVSIIAGVKLGF